MYGQNFSGKYRKVRKRNFGKWKMESLWKDISEVVESDEIDWLREKGMLYP
jgi:hypothetical protein